MKGDILDDDVPDARIVERSCGTCEHGNDAETVQDGTTHCTLRGGFYHGKLMQVTTCCEAWEPYQP